MLAVRIIPTLLKRGDKLVKGKRFDSWRTVGVVEQAFRIHQARGVDEICLLDVAATPENRGPDFDSIERLTESCFSPVTVGGGVRSVEDVKKLLAIGADKVAICTQAWPLFGPLIRECADKFGSQAIVASVDYKNNTCYLDCGTVPASSSPVDLAVDYERLGAGEILLTCIDRDGTMEGYDLFMIKAVCEAVSIPVIASGGCSGYEDMVKAVEAGASAVAAGALFLFGDYTPKGAAKYLHAVGIEARV